MKCVKLILFISFFCLNLAYAQIHSTTSGGFWGDPDTWVGGIVPGAADNAIINGNVYVANSECNDLTIANSGCALHNISAGNGSITIHGNLINNGNISNFPSGSTQLTVNLYGNLSVGFSLYPQTLNLLGTGNRTLSCASPGTISAVATISVAATIDTL